MFIQKSLVLSVAVASLSVNALPTTFIRGITQTGSDSTKKWIAACESAGSGDQCRTISETAIQALLASSDPCAQQDAADEMINLAKTLNNNEDMIRSAKIFVQQPRNSANSQAVLYCQKTPQNTELKGLYPCQFEGVEQSTFTGNLPVGQAGTIPYGLTAAVNPAGSCPAHPAGPIPDGTQLADITNSPGSVAGRSVSVAPHVRAASDSIERQNALDAQSLNNQFATLTSSSPCKDGEQACVGTAVAQCVGGKFSLTECPSGSICAAIPLLTGSGTSITCTTAAKRDALISAALAS